MSKTDVYSWRLASELKRRLESRAQADGVSVARLVEKMVREGLEQEVEPGVDEQRRLHEAAALSFGSLAGADPKRSRRVRSRVREAVERRRRMRSS